MRNKKTNGKLRREKVRKKIKKKRFAYLKFYYFLTNKSIRLNRNKM